MNGKTTENQKNHSFSKMLKNKNKTPKECFKWIIFKELVIAFGYFENKRKLQEINKIISK